MQPRAYKRDLPYQRQLVRVATDLGEMAAYAYIARPDHEQYCGALPETEAAQLIATATGRLARDLARLFRGSA